MKGYMLSSKIGGTQVWVNKNAAEREFMALGQDDSHCPVRLKSVVYKTTKRFPNHCHVRGWLYTLRHDTEDEVLRNNVLIRMTQREREAISNLRLPKPLLHALQNIDWGQVAMHCGSPCFHVEKNGRFCMRSERWEGHGFDTHDHDFVPLEDMVRKASTL